MTGPAIVTSPALIWGAYDPSDWQLDNPTDTPRVAAYAAIDALVGKKMSLTAPQCSWVKGHNADGSLQYRAFPRARLQVDRDLGRYSILSWLSWNLANQADQAVNLRSIILGQHDAYIAQFAKDAAAWAHPFVIRFDHEMNGWWFNSWSEQDSKGLPANGNQIGDYVKAWQHVVDLCRANGASNITWFWCPNQLMVPGTVGPLAPDKLAQFYPGDRYADLVGSDIYNKGTSHSAPWMTVSQVLSGYPGWCGDTYGTITRLAPGKRFFIGELSCHDAPGNKAAWILDAFVTMPKSYPQISGWCWFNWQIPPQNWPINIPPVAATAFATGVSSSVYLPAGGFPWSPDLGPVQPYSLVQTPDLDQQIASLQAAAASATSIAASAALTAAASLASLGGTITDLHAQLDAAAASDVVDAAALAVVQQTATDAKALYSAVQGNLRDLLKVANDHQC